MNRSILYALFILVIIYSCKKNDSNSNINTNAKPTPNPLIQCADGRHFANQLDRAVTLDIYDSVYWFYRFHVDSAAIRITIPAKSSVTLTPAQLKHGHRYFYDWYTSDFSISSWNHMPDAYWDNVINTGKHPLFIDSFYYYYYGFYYDSTSQNVLDINGHTNLGRIICFDNKRHGYSEWLAIDAYNSSGNSVWNSMPAADKYQWVAIAAGYGTSHTTSKSHDVLISRIIDSTGDFLLRSRPGTNEIMMTITYLRYQNQLLQQIHYL